MPDTIYKVLIVDDEQELCNLLECFLSQAGHDCHTANNGAEALRVMAHQRFDVVITDIEMPVMDGISLTRDIIKNCGDLPIMIITGYSNDYTTNDAIQAGAREFIVKPFTSTEFMLRFAKMMRDFQLYRQLRAEIG